MLHGFNDCKTSAAHRKNVIVVRVANFPHVCLFYSDTTWEDDAISTIFDSFWSGAQCIGDGNITEG